MLVLGARTTLDEGTHTTVPFPFDIGISPSATSSALISPTIASLPSRSTVSPGPSSQHSHDPSLSEFGTGAPFLLWVFVFALEEEGDILWLAPGAAVNRAVEDSEVHADGQGWLSAELTRKIPRAWPQVTTFSVLALNPVFNSFCVELGVCHLVGDRI